MHIAFSERIIRKFRQKRWPALIVGAAFLALCVAVQFAMVQILPVSP